MKHLRIGTRGSLLAKWQAEFVRKQLFQLAGVEGEIVIIKTSGDKLHTSSLSQIGGKGIFIKELEDALLAGTVDLAVHSMKDVPTEIPKGLAFPATLRREDVRDCLISRDGRALDGLPRRARIGTGSLRRQAQLLYHRPDLQMANVRGNVDTRLRKLADGEYDAIVLAMAGLNRLGAADKITQILEAEFMLPAVGQGAIGIETRADDAAARSLAVRIGDADTATALIAERAFLAVLDGSCRTPIGGHAQVSGETIRFRGMVVLSDGSEAFEVYREGRREEAAKLGADAGRELKDRAGADFFTRL